MTFQPTSSLFTKRVADRAIDTTSTGTVESISLSEPVGPLVNTLIIGSIALDSISKIAGTTKLNDSNPGSTTTSLGGVGFNLAKACSLGLKSLSCNGSHSSSRLISIIGDDFTGDSIMGQLQSKGFDTSGIFRHKSSDCSTAQYTSIHNGDGGLMLACADMSIIEHPDFTNHILEQIERARPIQIVIDCNLTPECITSILEKIHHTPNPPKVVIEPTSGPKARRIGQLKNNVLKPFPHNSILLITPTVSELSQIYETFSSRGLFDDFDLWFPLLDALGVNSQFRERLSISKEPAIKQGIEMGYLQQAFQILPYIPNILLKLGEKGVLLLSISTDIEDYKSIPTTSQYLPKIILTTSAGKVALGGEGSGKMGICIQYFPVPIENENIAIKNVTGAGDSLLGYLSARLLSSNSELEEGTWLELNISSVEQEWYKWESIYKSQIAAGKSLQSNSSISEDIKTI